MSSELKIAHQRLFQMSCVIKVPSIRRFNLEITKFHRFANATSIDACTNPTTKKYLLRDVGS